MMAEFTWCSKDGRRRGAGGVGVSPLSPIIPSSSRPTLLRRPPVCLPGLSMGTGASDGGASSSPLSGGGSGRTAMDPWPPMSTETNDVGRVSTPFFGRVCPSVGPSVYGYVLLWLLLSQTDRPVAADAHTHARTGYRLQLSLQTPPGKPRRSLQLRVGTSRSARSDWEDSLLHSRSVGNGTIVCPGHGGYDGKWVCIWGTCGRERDWGHKKKYKHQHLTRK